MKDITYIKMLGEGGSIISCFYESYISNGYLKGGYYI